MKLSDLTSQAGEWLRGSGPMSDIVISSRIRLARNVSGFPFLTRCTRSQRQTLEHKVRDTILAARLSPKTLYVDLESAPEIDRQLLVERHLISRPHKEAEGARGVAVGENETLSIMVNEEDHLRIQVLRSGLQLEEAWEQINAVDDQLEATLDFAFHPRFGYLTACPTNVGTGIRVSVMLHLPALKLTSEIEKVFCAAKELRLAVRGLYGEGTEATGDFYQISKQTTLGKSEEEIIGEFEAGDPQDHRLRAPCAKGPAQRAGGGAGRQGLAGAGAVALGEADGDGGNARGPQPRPPRHQSQAHEDIEINKVNELFLLTQEAHLQRILGKKLEGDARKAARAEFIRQRLSAD